MNLKEKEEYIYKVLAGTNKEGKKYRLALRTACLIASFLIWELLARLVSNNYKLSMALAILCLTAAMWALSSVLCTLIQDYIVLPYLFKGLEKEKNKIAE